ncbi:hypothetical protein [Paraburkholderia hayleyella]|uniref:hypothetical protein n=1 Tax=Paraburkholderia hayleyella TaxID=2152889 RepID=UPI001290EAC2|nr:hypothetical protein [Paraburkholderia hayleyella]
MNHWIDLPRMFAQNLYLSVALFGTFALLALEAWLVWRASKRGDVAPVHQEARHDAC